MLLSVSCPTLWKWNAKFLECPVEVKYLLRFSWVWCLQDSGAACGSGGVAQVLLSWQQHTHMHTHTRTHTQREGWSSEGGALHERAVISSDMKLGLTTFLNAYYEAILLSPERCCKMSFTDALTIVGGLAVVFHLLRLAWRCWCGFREFILSERWQVDLRTYGKWAGNIKENVF